MISDATYIECRKQAYAMGQEAARNAASWIADGNTHRRHIVNVLRMFEDGDPAVWDYVPTMPNLSGEWADSPTPMSLYEDIVWDKGEGIEADPDFVMTLADAYEEGVSDTFEHACIAELHKWLED